MSIKTLRDEECAGLNAAFLPLGGDEQNLHSASDVCRTKRSTQCAKVNAVAPRRTPAFTLAIEGAFETKILFLKSSKNAVQFATAVL